MCRSNIPFAVSGQSLLSYIALWPIVDCITNSPSHFLIDVFWLEFTHHHRLHKISNKLAEIEG